MIHFLFEKTIPFHFSYDEFAHAPRFSFFADSQVDPHIHFLEGNDIWLLLLSSRIQSLPRLSIEAMMEAEASS